MVDATQEELRAAVLEQLDTSSAPVESIRVLPKAPGVFIAYVQFADSDQERQGVFTAEQLSLW